MIEFCSSNWKNTFQISFFHLYWTLFFIKKRRKRIFNNRSFRLFSFCRWWHFNFWQVHFIQKREWESPSADCTPLFLHVDNLTMNHRSSRLFSLSLFHCGRSFLVLLILLKSFTRRNRVCHVIRKEKRKRSWGTVFFKMPLFQSQAAQHVRWRENKVFLSFSSSFFFTQIVFISIDILSFLFLFKSNTRTFIPRKKR